MHPLTKHVHLSLYFDFNSKTIDGSMILTLEIPYVGYLYLDTRCLKIHGVYHGASKSFSPFAYIPFLLENLDPIKGFLLKVSLTNQSSFAITFKTHQYASTIQWLNPSQTTGKKIPYLYTQCQSIHARSIFPCQDTPIARIWYSVVLNIPEHMSSVMSTAHKGRMAPSIGEAKGACPNEKWVMHGIIVEHFSMQQPIPPYLFAFVVGNIVSKEVDPRTRIYSEPCPILEAAENEFKNTEEMMKQGVKLFGEHEWERFDILVLPPSFPYGGMENLKLAFLTPTVIAGDLSGG